MTRTLPARPPRVAAVGLTLAALLVAGGCSGDDSSGDQRPPSEDPSSEDVGEPPVELEEDGLPVDFPRDDVPLVDGDVVSVSEPNDDNGAYTLVVTVTSSPVEAVTQAVGQLESNGWSARTELTGEPPVPQVLTLVDGEADRVIITNEPQGETTNVTYSVALTNG